MVISRKLSQPATSNKGSTKTNPRSARTWWMGIFLPINFPYKSALNVGEYTNPLPILWILPVINPTKLSCLSQTLAKFQTLFILDFCFPNIQLNSNVWKQSGNEFEEYGSNVKLVQNHHLLGFVLVQIKPPRFITICRTSFIQHISWSTILIINSTCVFQAILLFFRCKKHVSTSHFGWLKIPWVFFGSVIKNECCEAGQWFLKISWEGFDATWMQRWMFFWSRTSLPFHNQSVKL